MKTIDWQELVATSHLETVGMIRQLVDEHDYEEAIEGLNELYEAMGRAERLALNSQLRRLMAHILKWKYQPNKRSTSWVRSIVNARQEIYQLQEYMPSLTNEYIESVWKRNFDAATEVAKAEMNISRKDKFEPAEMTWSEAFEDEYLL
ncbi:DUF29 domain-containing protein [Fibrisoma montanum]|uniref:DUF29 domain-containing protein n=1 Tax=Fibrisoma montanum TaxID=2305895 RepID=A0A418M898_9BACT|nr:DUF29 domain-containing protein [Fibrisoma montanum]RIV22314.1 DUF29 domain-containing protein [Fibrisoma montanum]